ncbi:MAG: restriction endonuclease subunit S [Propionibacteriaceae bacterium]|nr:restriction endonuclease subunit S [Propionibacteriaceae bacterium]
MVEPDTDTGSRTYLALEQVPSWSAIPRWAISIADGNRFTPDDVLFGKLRPYLAKVVKADRSGVCVGEFWVLRSIGDLTPPFTAVLLRSKPMIDLITSTTYGAKMPRASWGVVGCLRVPVPPQDEQRAIVKYLNHAHARINATITKKRKLIALLEEQKQALINQAVTRGLDPNVEMKDSGVPWLGEIPSHWEVLRVKTLFEDVDHRSEDGGEELLSVSHITGVTPRSEKNVTMFKAETNVGHKVCRPGDLVFNTMWVWMGALGVSHHDGIVSPAYNVYRPVRADVDADYYSSLFRTPSYVGAFASLSTGITKSRLRFYPDDLAAMPTILPPMNEQKAIVSHINTRTASIQRAITYTQREIDLLTEFRTRLTSDVVTGQVDVRSVASTLPDLPDSDLSDLDESMEEPEEVDVDADIADDE